MDIVGLPLKIRGQISDHCRHFSAHLVQIFLLARRAIYRKRNFGLVQVACPRCGGIGPIRAARSKSLPVFQGRWHSPKDGLAHRLRQYWCRRFQGDDQLYLMMHIGRLGWVRKSARSVELVGIFWKRTGLCRSGLWPLETVFLVALGVVVQGNPWFWLMKIAARK